MYRCEICLTLRDRYRPPLKAAPLGVDHRDGSIPKRMTDLNDINRPRGGGTFTELEPLGGNRTGNEPPETSEHRSDRLIAIGCRRRGSRDRDAWREWFTRAHLVPGIANANIARGSSALKRVRPNVFSSTILVSQRTGRNSTAIVLPFFASSQR